MADEGIIATATIGGFELGAGSKPRELVCVITSFAGSSSLINKDGTVSGHTLGSTALNGHTPGMTFGAGSVSIAATTGLGVLVFGTGDNKDPLNVVAATGSIIWKDGAVTAPDEPGYWGFKSSNGGTVNFLATLEAGDAPAAGDSYTMVVRALVKGY